jgi:hypothetical protein
MKKITVIFIVVFCLISFTEISSLAKEHPIAGEVWNDINMSDIHKNIYLQGIAGGFILSGIIISITGLSDWNNFILQNNETIIKVMDDLYKDPANTYIDWCLICLVACQKLKGEDVEQLLKDFRKIAYQKYQRLIEK